ncbi:MAG: OmpA family protein [Myxococcota bacterium]
MRTVLVLIALAGCKKKTPEVAPPPPPTIPPATLQVVSVSPGRIDPDQARTVSVYGSGLASGALVSVGDVSATSVSHRSDNQLEVSLPGLPAGQYDVRVTNPDQSVDVLYGGLSVAIAPDAIGCEFVALYFETNQTKLLPAAVRTLGELVPCYERTELPIRIAGHADARGTTDYNLSLSYNRALVVQEWLVGAGIGKARLPVTSYGEERPAQQGTGEAVWAQNRRVELTID